MIKKVLCTAFCALTVGTTSISAQATDIGMETATAASVVGLLPQTMASYWGEDGINVQLSMGQTLTKSLLKVASGKLDSAIVPTPAFYALQDGKGPYAKMGDKAVALSKNVRALFGFPASFYHAVVWADSDIKSWEDAVGKRVYIGPPAGAANNQIRSLAKAGGLEPGTYEEVKTPWGVASQSFQDGQFDVYVGSFGLGSQSLSEMSLQRPIRLLSVKPENRNPPKTAGMAGGVIPAGTYPGVVNESDVYTFQTLMFVGVNKDMPDDVAYQLTKSYLENVSKIAESNPLMKHLGSADPFAGVVGQIHPGAARYYEEQGIEIPEEYK
ncbi:TAXI family TRAP transporter solute-binding subunit [Marinobacterium lacunae]|nr:TAXI family TRAP transporter solute-binding subunit [Marinobacterium lacunae]